MKKLLLILISAASSGAVFAQGNINKGNLMVGGTAGFNSTKTEDVDNAVTTVNISPNVGYFFINNLAGGLRLGFESSKAKGSTASTQFQFAPFLRYYFLPSSQKVNVFADASYGGGTQGGSNKESFNFLDINAGAAVFLTPATALEFGLGYTSYGGDAFKYQGTVKRRNTIGLNIGFQVHLP